MPKECCVNTWDNKIAEDEPVFILRGNDRLAPTIIKFWYELALLVGVNKEKLEKVQEHIEDMENYQASHPDHVKIPD